MMTTAARYDPTPENKNPSNAEGTVRKFRVLSVDTFANPPYGDPAVLADCDTKEDAIKLATAHGRKMEACYVCDSAGKYLFGKP